MFDITSKKVNLLENYSTEICPMKWLGNELWVSWISLSIMRHSKFQLLGSVQGFEIFWVIILHANFGFPIFEIRDFSSASNFGFPIFISNSARPKIIFDALNQIIFLFFFCLQDLFAIFWNLEKSANFWQAHFLILWEQYS